jgi:diguanylate cyclase (GGDEF)-like protein
MSFLEKLEIRSKPFQLSVVFALIGIVGIFDFLTGYELAFSLFYAIPVSLAAWLQGRRLGMFASLLSALVWLGADVVAGHSYSHPFIPVWNTLIRFSFFGIIALLLPALRNAMQRERTLARTDSLTGAVNSRHFFESAQTELDRLQRYRHPFTLAYIDIDNFKAINDQYGHSMGDNVLCAIVSYSQKRLRKIDVIARLGGDEFALLLPETNQEAAQAAVSKLQGGLLEAMRQSGWPITFSIGVLTCTVAPHTNDELVKIADELMYSVKHSNKNAIKYSTYTG